MDTQLTVLVGCVSGPRRLDAADARPKKKTNCHPEAKHETSWNNDSRLNTDWTWVSKGFFPQTSSILVVLLLTSAAWRQEAADEELKSVQKKLEEDTHFCSKMERATKFKFSRWLDTACHCYLELPAQPLSSVTCSHRSRSFRAWKMQLRRARSWYRDPGQHFVRLLDHRKSATQKKHGKLNAHEKTMQMFGFWDLYGSFIWFYLSFLWGLGIFAQCPGCQAEVTILQEKLDQEPLDIEQLGDPTVSLWIETIQARSWT